MTLQERRWKKELRRRKIRKATRRSGRPTQGERIVQSAKAKGNYKILTGLPAAIPRKGVSLMIDKEKNPSGDLFHPTTKIEPKGFVKRLYRRVTGGS